MIFGRYSNRSMRREDAAAATATTAHAYYEGRSEGTYS